MATPVPPLSTHQRDLMALGLCPFCEAKIRGWEPMHSVAYDASGGYCVACHARQPDDSSDGSWHQEQCRWRTYNSRTGHRRDCPPPQVTVI